MQTPTFDLGTDNLLTDEPSVIEWMMVRADAKPSA